VHGNTNTPIPEREYRISDMIPLDQIEFVALDKRRLSHATCEFWSYGVAQYTNPSTRRMEPCQVAVYRTPEGVPVAQKLRFADKTFTILGNGKDLPLYGQHLWRDGGKMVVVTEGELDALSVSQLQGNKWPVVSIPGGGKAARAALSRQIEWLSKFDAVILMFDNDAPGLEAVSDCVELFQPGKCKVARLPLKDASDMLQAERGAEVIQAMWSAKTQRPDGIVAGTDLWDTLIAEDKVPTVMYPYSFLNDKLYGIRAGEIVTVCAGSGIGKSTFVAELEHWLLTNEKETIGVVHLEQSVKKAALGLVGIECNKRLSLTRPNEPLGVSTDTLRAAYEKTVGSGRCFLYDHWGSSDPDNLLSKIRYMVRGCGASTIFLDHVSIVVSGLEDGDERRLIDNLMTKLRSLVEELQCRLILVSHLKRPEGKGHEEGAITSLSQLRGSAAIGQLSDVVLGLERNQQDPENKNLSQVRSLKSRITGETGVLGQLLYNSETGRLLETSDTFTPVEAGEKAAF
jgi:twinkle protein